MTPSPPTPLQTGLSGLCPRCGAKTLFSGIASFAASCRGCGLSFASFNVGDGPAAFLTMGVGALVTMLAIMLELTVHPPMWLHLILWIPITAGAVLGSLRIAKGMLIALEYRNAAREGRIVEEDE